ncbi:hypothetical protein [Aureimonas sp. Leaf454]|uniref:hypothetical protein n=1 Tax=Aureimonas sp. Leaf454 TaxID=1736381 RepID=UPI000A5BEB85|nr:hypothetical protein [Aureimonas sp. Leaf454]
MAGAASRAVDPIDTTTPEDDAVITAATRRDRDDPPLLFQEEAGPGEGAWLDIDLIERLRSDGPDRAFRANRILREALWL